MNTVQNPSAPVKTSKPRKPAAKPTRTVRLVTPIKDTMPGVIKISMTKGKKTLATDYFVSVISSDFGDGFKLEKILPTNDEPATYSVNLSNEGHKCECQGFLRHGTCKHVDSLVALRDRQLI